MDHSRREFLKQSALTGAGITFAAGFAPLLLAGELAGNDTPAILGGRPVHQKNWPGWPIWDPATDEKRVIDILRSGRWTRREAADEFEQKWSSILGIRRCLVVVNGTNALITALSQLDIGGGDEVIVTPYTFIATVDAILATGAMPVFADIDPKTFQIDPRRVEEKISPRTRAILPVHILGLPADMIRIMEIARKHHLVVVEDACQAHLAEINHQKVGTFGNAGCFSFQNSKNLPIGEGGAIVSNDDAYMDKCYSYHNYGDPYRSVGNWNQGTYMRGSKFRMTEYQAAIGLAQLTRVEAQATTRNGNAGYLKSLIKDIPGIVPYRLYDQVTRAAFHLFPFRYKKEAFEGLPRSLFLKALTAEGIPCSGGYTPLNKMPYLENTFRLKNYQKMYPPEALNITRYQEQNQCLENDRLCEEAVWFTQNLLLGSRSDMQDIATAITRIHRHAGSIKKALDK